jgi:hypothetical protein
MANYSLCGASVANTGEQACDVAKGVLKKLFIFNGAIEAADYVDVDTFFNKMVANSKLAKTASNKVFPIHEAQDLADSSDANKEGTLNLGFKTVLLEGKPGYKVKFFAGADLLKRLRTFNNKSVRIIEYDDAGVFWGTKVGTDFKGYQARLFVTGGKIATGQAVEGGVVELTVSILSTSEYFDNSYWMESTGNVEDIAALLDLPLSFISKASNVFKIGINIPGSNLIGPYNTFDEIGAALAALSANFSAGTGTNYGTSLAITSIAVDNALKCLTVTFDNTAFTALPALTKIKLNGPTPAQLDAGDVTETEVLSVILTN